ncbi:MAG: hypothetical protein WAQ25_02800 [Candidatus Saccharimonas sp.]
MNRVAQNRSVQQLRARRIGKKAIVCGRTLTAIERKLPKPKKRRTPKLPVIRMTRARYAGLIGALLLTIGGTGGYMAYSSFRANQQRIAEQEKVERDRKASIKSNECRQQKLAAKKEQLGKITYDELYDYTVCDFTAQ